MARISFFRPKTSPLPLPANINRTLIPTPYGSLELLCAEPANTSTPRKDPLFFAHGGCGSAAVWLEYMTFFSQSHDIPCYALSYRGHGNSWYPNFIRMYFTTKRQLADDLVSGVQWVQEQEKGEVVLVGHSSGGGLSQLALSDGDLKVHGLVLMGSISGYGSTGVNLNWLRMDPWFNLRMMWHLGHLMSPLSSTRLVKQAFFCPAYPEDRVIEFEKRMPHTESFLWPMGMLWRFEDPQAVLKNIIGWGSSERLMVLAAEKDRLMCLNLNERLAGWFRQAFGQLVASKNLEAKAEDVTSKGLDSVGLGVRMEVVESAGHHLQNDIMWGDGAKRLLRFYEGL